jgi:predicted ribosome quality control (RQC) complex YloA/Tae2 family protein
LSRHAIIFGLEKGALFLPVVVGFGDQLGTLTSSVRFKEAIKPMDKASEAVFSLRPVTFRYKQDIDPDGIRQFGLVAEDVEKISPDLVVRDRDGKPYTVRYEAVNAMLLNEFLKQHRTVQKQQKEIDALRAELKEQRALIQMVNDKVELNRPAPLLAENNH